MKCIVIGPSGAGKTSLCNALTNKPGIVKKTQAIEFIGDFIDTPGEYVNYSSFYPRLFVSCQQAELVIFLIAADQKEQMLPQDFARAFFRPVIGVVNKIELQDADEKRARDILSYAGVEEPYFFVSVYTGQGLDNLQKRISTISYSPAK